jgi:hypothetical protein
MKTATMIFSVLLAGIGGAQAFAEPMGSSGGGTVSGAGAASSTDSRADMNTAGDTSATNGSVNHPQAGGSSAASSSSSKGPPASGYTPGTNTQNETAPAVKHAGHADF